MKESFVIVLLATAAYGQQQRVQDLSQLVGRQVIAQRMGLCQAGTYNVLLAYAGKRAKVISVKPSNIPYLTEKSISKMPPDSRAMMEDFRKGGTILVQFEDGTKIDTCGPIGPSQLSNYFELAPGETLQPATQGGTGESVVSTSSVPAPSTGAPPATLAQPNLLSDEEVKAAMGGKGKDHWVEIQDMGLMAAQGNQVPAITLYMPEAILARQAEAAKKQFTRYEPSDEERQRSLVVVARGYAGKTITEGCTTITRVVLVSDPSSGGVVEESYLSEPLGETWRNNFGAVNECQALRAKFWLDDVRKAEAAAPNGEFFVAVFSGTVRTKVYKIKKKHQSKLELE
jgi:hypothetical protein